MSEGTPNIVIHEEFSRGMENWWVEGGEQVWIENARLMMRSDGPDPDHGSVCTAWCRIPHPPDFVLELDAHVVSSKTNSNNINLFFCYSDPSGVPLFESRHTRRNADYGLYHQLNGHIITFLNDSAANNEGRTPAPPRARVRMRRCPGFNLLKETFDYHCGQGVTYHLQVIKKRGHIAFSVDGKPILEAVDPEPLGGGLLGLRTFKTFLWWDNIKLTALEL